ncbi:MAG: amidohydrolase [Planctomycetota bacterium]|jgi:imidazolonepropionase-like amidohydrolase
MHRWLVAPLLLLGSTASAQDGPLPSDSFAVVGARLETASEKGRIEDGVVVVRDGKITAVGERADVEVPGNIPVFDAGGRTLLPGIIDTHSHMGVYSWPGGDAHADGNEATDPITPEVRALDSVNAEDPAFALARAGGVTTVMVLPGSANLIGGQAATLKLRPGGTVDAMKFEEAPANMKMAFGENPKRVYGGRGGAPSTRMGNLAVLRRAFSDARNYAAKWETYMEKSKSGDREAEQPEKDLRIEALWGMLRGEFRLQVHCYTRSDILSLLRFADEHRMKVTAIHHALEAYKARHEIKKHGAAVCTWADWWGFKIEAKDGIPENAALCAEAGVSVCVHSDSSEGVQRLFHEAAKMMAAGLSRTDAVRGLTINGAKALGIEKWTGSLEVGKDADLALFSGDPFSVFTRVDATWIDGRVVFQRERR